MATMNRPSSGNTNWAQDVNDNWISVETNLITKSLIPAKGDLIAASGGSTPAKLGIGSNGQILKADSSQSSGLKWTAPGAFTSQEKIDLLWGKKFFEDEGFLPSTKMFEYVGTPPAFSGTAGTGTWTREAGAARASTANAIAWYDLGASKSKILFVLGCILKKGTDIFSVILAPNQPTAEDPDGFLMINWSSGPAIYKNVSGVGTRLDSSTGFTNVDYMCGYALYYDDATDVLKMFLRFGQGQWFLAQSATSTQFTTLRYMCIQAGTAADQRFITPFVCYAQ